MISLELHTPVLVVYGNRRGVFPHDAPLLGSNIQIQYAAERVLLLFANCSAALVNWKSLLKIE